MNFPVIRALWLKRRVFPCILGILLLAVCFAQAEDTGSLVRERCLGCHEMDKVCDVESNDAQWWNTTVLRMVEYKDGLLTEGESASISAFLADGGSRASVCASQ